MKKLFKKIRPILKDVLKFYFCLTAFLALSFFLIEIYSHRIDPLRIDFETYDALMEKIGMHIFGIACLMSLISVPPKSFGHISFVAILISLIGSPVFLYDSVLEWGRDFIFLYGYVLLAWICSHIGVRLRPAEKQ